MPGGRGVCEAQCHSIEENENGRVESDDSTCGGSGKLKLDCDLPPAISMEGR